MNFGTTFDGVVPRLEDGILGIDNFFDTDFIFFCEESFGEGDSFCTGDF